MNLSDTLINDLNKYKLSGSFTFNASELLIKKCNAPSNKSGVYIIFESLKNPSKILYIGSSGQKINGTIKTRKSGLGGMRDRLVNGYHPKFGKIKRKHSFPNQMILQNIKQLEIFWWVTWDDFNKDFPTDVEKKLRKIYLDEFHQMPPWHK